MKAMLIYWVIGCVAIGGALGLRKKQCPDLPDVPASIILITVATWPAAIGFGWYGPKESQDCK